MNIELTNAEMQIAIAVGSARQLSALASGKRDNHGAKADKAWTMHIEGAAGELAAAKALGIYFSATVDTYKEESDLPGGIEVRTRSQDYYDLLVRDDDPADDTPFVLVVGRPPLLRVPGWLYAHEARSNPDWVKSYANRKPAYFIPQDALHPIETLRTHL